MQHNDGDATDLTPCRKNLQRQWCEGFASNLYCNLPLNNPALESTRGMCERCHAECYECAGPGSTHCTACPTGKVLLESVLQPKKEDPINPKVPMGRCVECSRDSDCRTGQICSDDATLFTPDAAMTNSYQCVDIVTPKAELTLTKSGTTRTTATRPFTHGTGSIA